MFSRVFVRGLGAMWGVLGGHVLRVSPECFRVDAEAWSAGCRLAGMFCGLVRECFRVDAEAG